MSDSLFITNGEKPGKRVVEMKKTRFVPYLHHCKEGNHYHLVTGPDFGASPPFASMSNALLILGMAVEVDDAQDRRDGQRISDELKTIRVKSGKRNRHLWVRKRSWEFWTNRAWSRLLDGSLRATETDAFVYFTNIPCDFIEKRQAGSTLTLRGRRVSEVQTLLRAPTPV
jgi:hypothetical protein